MICRRDSVPAQPRPDLWQHVLGQPRPGSHQLYRQHQVSANRLACASCLSDSLTLLACLLALGPLTCCGGKWART